MPKNLIFCNLVSYPYDYNLLNSSLNGLILRKIKKLYLYKMGDISILVENLNSLKYLEELILDTFIIKINCILRIENLKFLALYRMHKHDLDYGFRRKRIDRKRYEFWFA